MIREFRRYSVLIPGLFMTNMMYPFAILSMFITNIVYILIVYFLWKSVYGSTESLHGMTFNKTFVQLTLAAAILSTLRNSVNIAGRIRSGAITLDLIRPVDFQLKVLAECTGSVLFGLVTNTIPCAIVVFLLVQGNIPLGANLPVFLVSLVAAYLLNFTIDFVVATLAFYTTALWGITIAKEVITSFLAGAIVPLAFFPESMQSVLRMLPFQAIYHTPLQILTNNSLSSADYVSMLGIQLFWLIICFTGSRLFFRRALKVLTVNGG